MTEDEWRGGLAPHYDFMLPGPPDDPAMRESASIWLFEENGAFALPRVGIEAMGNNWGNHRVDMNASFPGGRVLVETGGMHVSHSPLDAAGNPRILGSGPLRFEVIEPYKRWRISYDGLPVETTSEAMTKGAIDASQTTPLKWDVEIEMVTPCWVQDNTPERLVGKSEREMDDARSMGLGYRMEHQFRGSGTMTLDGETRPFKAVGNRIHRQSVRPLDGFRGHVWQAAVFPDGRAFAYIAYPPGEDGSTYNEGYVFVDGRMHAATAGTIPWLTAESLASEGQDNSLEINWDGGSARITGSGMLNTFKVMHEGEMAGFALNQGSTRYIWDGQAAIGMIERSTWLNQL
jgi:hypothetical protein